MKEEEIEVEICGQLDLTCVLMELGRKSRVVTGVWKREGNEVNETTMGTNMSRVEKMG